MGSGTTDTEHWIEVAEAIERERRRIARGLHDQIGRHLTDALQELERPNPGPRAEKVRRLVREALTATRTLTFDLGLPPIGDHGIAGLLETICRQTEARHEMRVLFEEQGESKDLGDGTVLVLAQIVRELLFNVVKHARASIASVALEYHPDRLRVVVTDDGIGLTGPVNANGFGLADARSRMCALGGRFEFGSKDGLGTCVVLELPLS